MLKIIAGIATVVYWLLGIIGLLIHVWTIIIVFSIHGFVGAVIAFILPVVSEIYLMFVSYSASGVFLTTYNAAVLIYAISTVIILIIIGAATSKAGE